MRVKGTIKGLPNFGKPFIVPLRAEQIEPQKVFLFTDSPIFALSDLLQNVINPITLPFPVVYLLRA